MDIVPSPAASRIAPRRLSASRLTATRPGRQNATAAVDEGADAASLAAADVRPQQEVEGMSQFLDTLKWDSNGLVTAIVQHVDTGELLMQAFADRAAVSETMQTGLATFWSRSRADRWCKGETSGHFISVVSVVTDCDHDSLVYLGDPIGPACHTVRLLHEMAVPRGTGCPSCYFTQVETGEGGAIQQQGSHDNRDHAALPTLLALERTIAQRRAAAESGDGGKSWTAKLLGDPMLLCSKVREEAGELCETREADEGPERAASEAADLLYHTMVLLNSQGVKLEDVTRILRKRFGTSGIAEKAARAPKPTA